MTSFYFDEHMNRAVADALIERRYQVVMTVDVDMESKDDDAEHLPYDLAPFQRTVFVS